jgi:hypothetical protein
MAGKKACNMLATYGGCRQKAYKLLPAFAGKKVANRPAYGWRSMVKLKN